MRILLDECVPRKLKFHLPGHDCKTVAEAGMAGKSNGELLGLAEAHQFEVFLTIDQGIEYQQNLSNRRITILVLHAKSNRLAHLVRLVPRSLVALGTIRSGQLIHVNE